MLGHGNFGKWLAAEFGWTDRTARNFMGAAKLVDGKSEKISVLPVSAIYKLAAPSTPETVRDAIVARVESGDIPSSREIHTAIVEGKKRESDDRAAKAKLDRRLLGKAPKDQERIRKEEERKRRKHEQEQAQQRQEQEKAEEAARAAVELLRSNLGSELPAFAALFNRAGSLAFCGRARCCGAGRLGKPSMNARAELAAACAACDLPVFTRRSGQESPLVPNRNGGSGVNDAVVCCRCVFPESWTEPVGESAP